MAPVIIDILVKRPNDCQILSILVILYKIEISHMRCANSIKGIRR